MTNAEDREARRLRILELRDELARLVAEDNADSGSQQAVLDLCNEMLLRGLRVEAIKTYRARMGCSLREAGQALGILR